MAIPYEAEIQRLVAEVEDGGDLFSLVFESPYTQEAKLFIEAMDSTMFPDAYIELVKGRRVNMDERTRWMLLAPTVVFFAMCAEIRWNIAEREEQQQQEDRLAALQAKKPVNPKTRRFHWRRKQRRMQQEDEN